MMTKHKRFIIVFFLPILLILPFGAANYVFLLNAGELSSIETIANAQQRVGGLYGTAVHGNSYPYKLDLYAARRPQVVVIGSSRVLQLRESFFTQSFVNLGRAIDYPLEAEQLVADMLRIAKPKLVLFGLDYWWGNPRWVHSYTFARHQMRGGVLTPDAMLAPTNWLIGGKLSLDTYLDVMGDGRPVMIDGAAMYGVQAITRGRGFGPDGSLYDAGLISGRKSAEDVGFRDTRAHIEAGTAQFRYGSEIMAERIDSLRRVIDVLRRAGVPTITFLPPLAPSIAEIVRERGEQYGFIPKFREQVATLNPFHYDFHGAGSLDATDCEFTDGFHSGEVVFARMLSKMAEDTGNGLARFLNREAVQLAIRIHAGKAIIDTRFRRDGEREVDFLELGCDKT